MPYFDTIENCKKKVAKDLEKIPNKYKNFTESTRSDSSKNPWKRMVIGILTCKRTKKRFDNFMTIFKDIFNKFGLDYYIIHADPNIQPETGKDYIVDHKNKIFTAKASEAYENLSHKLAIFYSYVHSETKYDYVVKVDDGCLLDLSRVISKLDKDYIGSAIVPTLNTIHRNKCKNKKLNKIDLDFGHNLKKFNPEKYELLYKVRFGGGGYGYRISRNALSAIVKYKEHVLSLELSYEDVLLGQILKLEGIFLHSHAIGRYHHIGPNC